MLAVIDRRHIQGVVHLIGIMVLAVGAVMLIPLLTALILREFDPALDFGLGMAGAAIVGLTLLIAGAPGAGGGINRSQALMATAGGWLAGAMVGAIPLALCANYPTYVDALFDAMSGLTTSGLTVAVDLDHMAYSHNMWRHLTHLLGGQGIVVAALSLAIGGRSGGAALYEAEGRDERILPNIIYTTRFIWIVTGLWVAFGTVSLTLVNLWSGLSGLRAPLHAFWLTIAAYDTGGFAPQSANILYYHSGQIEALLMVLMLAGMLNFSLQAAVMQGDRREPFRNMETRIALASMGLLILVAAIGLTLGGQFDTWPEVIRKGVFHVVSAHSGTGYQTLYPSRWHLGYSGAGFIAVMLAMAVGGSVSSTSGGIKVMRLGIIAKTIILRVRESLLPRTAAVKEKYHHLTDRVVTSEIMHNALVAFSLFVFTYLAGGVVGTLMGYPMADALFESVSATANVGLSTGITTASMPVALKLTYITLMWAGRLEFVALFTLVAGLIAAVRSPRRRIA